MTGEPGLKISIENIIAQRNRVIDGERALFSDMISMKKSVIYFPQW